MTTSERRSKRIKRRKANPIMRFLNKLARKNKTSKSSNRGNRKKETTEELTFIKPNQEYADELISTFQEIQQNLDETIENKQIDVFSDIEIEPEATPEPEQIMEFVDLPELKEAIEEGIVDADFDVHFRVSQLKVANVVDSFDNFLEMIFERTDRIAEKFKKSSADEQDENIKTTENLKESDESNDITENVEAVYDITVSIDSSTQDKNKIKEFFNKPVFPKTTEKIKMFLKKIKGKLILFFKKPFFEKIVSFVQKYYTKIYTASQKENALKITLAASFSAFALFIAFCLYMQSITAFSVSYLGNDIGIVKKKEYIYNIVPDIERKLNEENEALIYIDTNNDFTFTQVRGRKLELINNNEIIDKFAYVNNINVVGYAIARDGIKIAILKDENDAQQVLEDIKQDYMLSSPDVEYKEVVFEENITVEEVLTRLVQLDTYSEAKKYIEAGTRQRAQHTVIKGDTLEQIAFENGLTRDELLGANPNMTDDQLEVGEKVNLLIPKPFLTVKSVELQRYLAEIPYEVITENTSSLYVGESRIRVQGMPGQQHVVDEVSRVNGKEIDRIHVDASVIVDPSPQYVSVGTKAVPKLTGSGSFQRPVSGKLTSRFGTRWGRSHDGIDISAPNGTAIYASDGGTVIFSGWDGAYGYAIRINHGGNRVTTYAHCSKLFVADGAKVQKGQKIANVGNTGRSTGPHLHFEIKINGKLKNPLDYVKY